MFACTYPAILYGLGSLSMWPYFVIPLDTIPFEDPDDVGLRSLISVHNHDFFNDNFISKSL